MRAELLFFMIKYANMWRSYRRRRRGYLISPHDQVCRALHMQKLFPTCIV